MNRKTYGTIIVRVGLGLVSLFGISLAIGFLHDDSSSSPILRHNAEAEHVEVTGVVHNYMSEPIATARVGIIISNKVNEIIPDWAQLDLSAEVDAKGEYKLRIPKKIGVVRVIARSSQFETSVTDDIVLQSNWIEASPILMNSGITVYGQVMDETRAPIEGATIEVYGVDDYLDSIPQQYKDYIVTSQSYGDFVLNGLANNRYALHAKRDGYETLSQETFDLSEAVAAYQLDIRMDRKLFLFGRVVDESGKSIAEANLAASQTSKPKISVKSDAQGRFRIGPFLRGVSVVLVASADRYGVTRSDDIIVPRNDLEILLRRNGSIRGIVIEGITKRPIREFKISFLLNEAAPMRTAPTPGSRFFKTDDGRFQWDNIMAGRWTVAVSADDYQLLTVPGIMVPPGGPPRDLSLELLAGYSVSGYVFDAQSGSPISNAVVTLHRGTRADNVRYANVPAENEIFKTDNAGIFTMNDLPGGEVTLGVGASGYGSTSTIVTPSDVQNVRISMSPAASIRGRVYLPDGTSPSSARVTLQSLAASTGTTRPTDESGYFAFPNVRAAKYYISAETEAGRTNQQDIVVAESQQIEDIRLAIVSGATLSGLISGLLPGETRNVLVTVRESGRFVAQQVADESGNFRIQGVLPGEYEMDVATQLGRSIRRQVSVASAYDNIIVDVSFNNRSARISGRITRNGRPAPFVIVNASPLDGQSIHGTGETSRSGQYAIEGLEKGRYDLSVIGSSGISKEAQVIGNVRVDFELPALTIAGTVRNIENLQPLSDVSIRLSSSDSGSIANNTTSNFEGNFLLSNFASGQYAVSAYKASFDLYFSHVSAQASVEGMELYLTPTIGSKLTVADASSQSPLQTVFVSALFENGTTTFVDFNLDAGGIAHLPQSFVGADLTFSWIGYEPKLVKSWDGSPITVDLDTESQ